MEYLQAAQNKVRAAQNRIVQTSVSIGQMVTPVLKESHFEEKGVLTPEEFVNAGDQLVRTCPTWQWAAGDASCVKPYLPADKQFLITRNVPCLRRVKALEADHEDEVEVEGEDGEVWLATHNKMKTEDQEEEVLETIAANGTLENAEEDAKEDAKEAVPKDTAAEEDSDEDSYINIDDFIDESLAEQVDSATLGAQNSGASNDNLVRTRTYDLSITYDKYYQTPRVWLLGYNEDGVPLSSKEMFEDIMQDYANRTVTMESHPHLSSDSSRASIHPCRHAKVMKRIIGYLKEGGGKARAEQYLFIFLKFIQSVIPTIDYDYTIEVQAR